MHSLINDVQVELLVESCGINHIHRFRLVVNFQINHETFLYLCNQLRPAIVCVSTRFCSAVQVNELQSPCGVLLHQLNIEQLHTFSVLVIQQFVKLFMKLAMLLWTSCYLSSFHFQEVTAKCNLLLTIFYWSGTFLSVLVQLMALIYQSRARVWTIRTITTERVGIQLLILNICLWT